MMLRHVICPGHIVKSFTKFQLTNKGRINQQNVDDSLVSFALMPCRLGSHSAINDNRLAGQECGPFAAQKLDEWDDIARLSEAA